MEKKFKKGLVLGKFMPPHNGHLFLINSAIQRCEQVFVMVCTLKNEPINGFMRWAWLKMLYDDNKNVTVIHVTDENPQKPEECESTDVFYNKYWVPSVKNRVKDLDVVFTSEDYGDEFANYLGIHHVLVDIERNIYPVSGTKVRNNSFQVWEHIPDMIKPYFTKRVLIVGPESTGKSTLCKKLGNFFDVEYIEEYGRTYTETIKNAKDLNKEDFYKIAKTHDNILLNIHEQTINKLIIIDTDALTTKIFGQMYLNNYNDDRVDAIINYQWFDLIFLMDIDVPWVDDGTRDFPKERQNHFNKIKTELNKLNRKYIVVSGNYEERFDKAKKECEKLIS